MYREEEYIQLLIIFYEIRLYNLKNTFSWFLLYIYVICTYVYIINTQTMNKPNMHVLLHFYFYWWIRPNDLGIS